MPQNTKEEPLTPPWSRDTIPNVRLLLFLQHTQLLQQRLFARQAHLRVRRTSCFWTITSICASLRKSRQRGSPPPESPPPLLRPAASSCRRGLSGSSFEAARCAARLTSASSAVVSAHGSLAPRLDSGGMRVRARELWRTHRVTKQPTESHHVVEVAEGPGRLPEG